MGNQPITKERRRKHWRSVWTVVVPTLVLCLGMLEGGLRLTGRVPSNTTDGFFEADNNSYRLKKNIDKLVKAPGYSFRVHINALGFRDASSGAREIGGNSYYLFLGESLTFGNGVDFEQSFVGKIGEALREQSTEVVNLAVGGHGFIDQVGLFDEFTKRIGPRPQKVFICFSPLFIEGFDRPFTDIIVKDGYLFKRGRWMLPFARIILGNTSSAYCFFRDSIRKIQARLSDFNRTVTQQLLAMYSVQSRFSGSSATAREFEAGLQDLDRRIETLGAEPVYVYVPLSTDFGLPGLIKEVGARSEEYDVRLYCRLLEEHCAASRIKMVDLSPALQRIYDEGEPLNFIQDAHYNAKANSAIADAILRSLDEDGPRGRQESPRAGLIGS